MVFLLCDHAGWLGQKVVFPWVLLTLLFFFFFSVIKTNLNKYLRKQRRFPRTISDFRRLAVYLTHAYSNGFVPALPKATNPHNLQRWLDIICRNDRLSESEALREFVESDVGFYPHPVKPPPRRRATSLLSTASGSSETVEDIDFDFVETKRAIEEFERHVTVCNRKGETDVIYRRGRILGGGVQ
jgi:hypothetical protein